MKKIKNKLLIFILAIIYVKCVFGEFIELKKYIGKHDSNCGDNIPMTGNIVKNKIYVFGGCYPIPNSIEHDMDDFFIFGLDKPTNVTNEIYVYDIDNDIWNIESYTPYPLVNSYTQVVNEKIYFFENQWNSTRNRIFNDMWIYNVNTKEWIQKEDIPFIWMGKPVTCQYENKIYFMGSEDGYKKNILHIYNTISEKWESSIALSKLFKADHIICKNEVLYILGSEESLEHDIKTLGKKGGIITIFKNMTSKYEPLEMTFENSVISTINNYVYVFGNGYGFNEDKNITRINLETYTRKNLGMLPSPITKPLVVNYGNAIYLFGGKLGKKINKCKKYDEDCTDDKINENIIKVLHHKFVPNEVNNNNSEIKLKIQN